MNLNPIIDQANMIEVALWVIALLSFSRTKVRSEIPSLGLFLSIRLLTPLLYVLVSHGRSFLPIPNTVLYLVYFYSFWPIYICGALAAFYCIQQIIRSVLSPLPGLSSLGVLFFRWAGMLSIVIAITAHLADIRGTSLQMWFTKLVVSFALCMCLFEVSLLSLLALTAKILGLSFRSRVFGVSLGLALLGITEFFSLALGSTGSDLVSLLNAGCELVSIGALCTLIFYIVRPEPKRGMLATEKASTLMRWNEIVREMGVGPPLPVERATNFMEDVESLVDRILRENAVGEA